MPRLDDPNIKLKEGKSFKRQSLRPWDNLDDFKPSILKTNELADNLEFDNKLIGKQLVNNKITEKTQIKSISKQLVNNKETISKRISKRRKHSC